MPMLAFLGTVQKPDKDTELINRISNIVAQDQQYTKTTEAGVHLDFDQMAQLNGAFNFMTQRRIENYQFYEHLDDNYYFCAGALNLLADDSCPIDLFKGKPFWIECDDERIKTLAEHLLYDRLELVDPQKAWATIRDLCKYGDVFEEIITEDLLGVVKLENLPQKTMDIQIDPKNHNLNYYQYLDAFGGQNSVKFEDWQVGHLKIPGRTRDSITGRSMLADAVRSLRMLESAELALLLQRLNRAQDNYIWQLAVDGLTQEEAQLHINLKSAEFRRKRLIDVKDGNFETALNVLTSSRDLFVGTRGDIPGLKVDLMPQGNLQQHIDDIEYFKSKSIESLQVPKAYLSYLEGEDTKSKLANTDIRWARKIKRIQQLFGKHLHKILDIHLRIVLKRQIPDFNIVFANPSTLDDQAKLEALEIRSSVAAALQDYYPLKTILTEIFKLSEDDASKYVELLKDQKIDLAKTEAIAQASADKMMQFVSGGQSQDMQQPGFPPEGEEEQDPNQPPQQGQPYETVPYGADIPADQKMIEQRHNNYIHRVGKDTNGLSKDKIIEMFKANLTTSKRLAEATENLHHILRLKEKMTKRRT